MPGDVARRVDAEEVLELGELFERDRHPRAALAVYQRLAAERAHHPAAIDARLGAARSLVALGLPVDAYQ